MKDLRTEIKSTQERINHRLEEAEAQISDLENRIMKAIKLKRREKKN